MAPPMVDLALQILGGYGAAGALFALAFVSVGAARVEKTAEGGSIGFRIAIFPGAVVLWPYLLFRWMRARKVTS